MEIINKIYITVDYTTQPLAGRRYAPVKIPSLGKNIEELIKNLKKNKISVDRKKSEKVFTNGCDELKITFDKEIDIDYNGLERYILRTKSLEITLDKYHTSDNTSRFRKIGGETHHKEGITAKLVYKGTNIENGEKTINTAKKIIDKFYRG